MASLIFLLNMIAVEDMSRECPKLPRRRQLGSTGVVVLLEPLKNFYTLKTNFHIDNPVEGLDRKY